MYPQSSEAPVFADTAFAAGMIAYYRHVLARVDAENLKVLRRMCSDLYRGEREHALWIDLGGEA